MIWLDIVACKLLDSRISSAFAKNFAGSISAPKDSKSVKPMILNASINALISVLTTNSVSLPKEPVSNTRAVLPSSSNAGMINTASPKSNNVWEIVACIIAEFNNIVWSASVLISVKSKVEANAVGSEMPNNSRASNIFSISVWSI